MTKRLIAVGEKLRVARREQQLSLRELASRAGVSASLLSQIESGKVIPSANSLYQIATALELPVHAFFPQTSEESANNLPGKSDHVEQPEYKGNGEGKPTYAVMESRSLTLPTHDQT